MTLDFVLYWTGAIFWIVLIGIVLLLLLYLLWLRFERLYREIYLWIKYDDFDDYRDFLAYRKCKDRLPKEFLCPHCGGTGLKDDDIGVKRELDALRTIAQRHPVRVARYFKSK